MQVERYSMITGRGAALVCALVAAHICTAIDANASPFDTFNWRYYRSLKLKVDSVQLNRNLRDFAVPLRLHRANFPEIEEVRAGGVDLRFCNAAGEMLPYEIEKWIESAIDTAVVWIKLDKVLAAAATEIKMYWGNQHAAAGSNGTDVFSRANNHLSVWHLGEAGDSSVLADATGKHSAIFKDSSANSTAAANASNGVLGRSVNFAGDRQVVVTSQDSVPVQATYSLWFKPRSYGTSGYGRMIIKESQMALLANQDNQSVDFGHHFTTENGKWFAPQNSMKLNQWQHVAVAYDNSAQTNTVTIYINGAHVATNRIIAAQGSAHANSNPVTFGNRIGLDRSFDGKLDEIRIDNMLRDSAYIAFTYAVQRPGADVWSIGAKYCTAPDILKSPTGRTVLEGDSIILTCQGRGIELSYQWQRYNRGHFNDIIGATSSHFRTVADPALNGARFRCEVISGCGAVHTTASATIMVVACPAPTILTQPAGMTVGEGRPAALRINASGMTLSFQWQRLAHDTAWQDVDGAFDSVYSFVAELTDQAAYRCKVTGCSKTTVSDPATLVVIPAPDTTAPVPASHLQVTASGPAALEIRWTTPESGSADAESVFVWCTTSPATLFDPADPVATMRGTVVDSVGERTMAVDGLIPQSSYYASLWIRDSAGNVAFVDSAQARTPAPGSIPNPLIVRGTRIDSAHVKLQISNFSSLPPFTHANVAYIDSIGIWYASEPDPAAGRVVRRALAELTSHGDSVDISVTVTPLSAADSFYYFAAAPIWHSPVYGDTIPPFVAGNGAAVLMHDTVRATMRLSFGSPVHTYLDSTLTISIDQTSSIGSDVQSVGIWYGFSPSPDFNNGRYTVWQDAAAVRSQDPFAYTIKDVVLTHDSTTVYYAAVLRSVNTTLSESIIDSALLVLPEPANPCTLHVAEVAATDITLTWNTASYDRVRIWYAKVQIPTGTVTGSQGFGLFEPLAVEDTFVTVSGLDEQTRYYFGLQVLRGARWSIVTEASRTTGLTRAPRPTGTMYHAPELLSLTFDTLRRGFEVNWLLDPLPAGSAEVGVTLALSAEKASAVPPSLPDYGAIAEITSQTGGIFIPVADLESDTTYFMALWLRAGGSPWVFPSKKSVGSVYLPELAWEPVAYFDPGTTTDTISVFDGAIVLVKDSLYDFAVTIQDTVDRVKSNKPADGLVPLSDAFAFRNRAYRPVWIGIRLDSIPTIDDYGKVAVYRDSAGHWQVEHGSVFDVNDKIAWLATDRLLDANNTSLPFRVMADMTPPKVSFINDTSALAAVQTALSDTFFVSDNISNVAWQVF
ncbi:MAG: DUF2341 domain-containing protein, partial [Chitinivibrionales bacterium]|nr:DUF2341 domain-containing protein [Chitinivibrionales bacterium]